VDLMRPSVAFASLRLLEAAGCEVIVPEGQTCCGQPAWSAGERALAVDLAKKAIAELPLKKFRASLFTAHLMGGCPMSENPKRGVVDSRGRHHQLANLSVMDGSVFPTSIGANPQLSIYGLTAQNASALDKQLRG